MRKYDLRAIQGIFYALGSRSKGCLVINHNEGTGKESERSAGEGSYSSTHRLYYRACGLFVSVERKYSPHSGQLEVPIGN